MLPEDKKHSLLPSSIEEVTEDWVRKKLKEIWTDGEFENVKIDPDRVQMGYLSSIVNVTFQKHGEMHKMFLKIMPPDKMHKDLVTKGEFDLTELESYKTIFQDLDRFTKQNGLTQSAFMNLFPKFYSGECDMTSGQRNFYLMLEDISDDYEMVDFNAGLSVLQLQSSLKALAEFHATAFCYKKKTGVDFEKKYNFLSTFFKSLDTQEMSEFINMNLNMLERDLERSDTAQHMITPVRKIRNRILKTYMEQIMSEDHKDYLIHGDLWANNAMFDDKNGKCKLVDWQFTCVGSIYLDIGTLLFYSMNPKETEKSFEKITRAYYDQVCQTCENLLQPLTDGDGMPWNKSFEEFSREVEKKGSLLAFLWCTTSYELVEKYPNLITRVHWTLEKAVERNPALFN